MEPPTETRAEPSTTSTSEQDLSSAENKSNEATAERQFTRSRVYAPDGLIFKVSPSLHSTSIPSVPDPQIYRNRLDQNFSVSRLFGTWHNHLNSLKACKNLKPMSLLAVKEAVTRTPLLCMIGRMTLSHSRCGYFK